MASFICIVLLVLSIGAAGARHDYSQALSKSILFYEAQRSGRLPGNQRANWRADSGLHDGKADGVDLVGGYYDAGDNVKFGLPMAFTVTVLSWSVVEYGRQLASSGELGYALEAIKWGTDYLLKAHTEPDVLYGEVGDGNTDHYCWQRPEDMTTSRQAYRVDAENPGSDLAGETAAAMAAASIAFRNSNPAYSNDLLNHARQLFQFADKYRGKYDISIPVVQKFYASKSGYADELLWAAAWLHEATGEASYLNYLIDNAESLGGTGWAITEFSWDVKYAGVQVLASKFLMRAPGGKNEAVLKQYQEKAEYFLCACLQKGNDNVQKTPGGLLFWQKWNNIQFVTSASFLMLAYSDYLSSSGNKLQCPRGSVQPSDLVAFAQSQIDYVLGDNPRATSYMIGYGSNYPRHAHHRASSIVSYKVNPTFINCRGGYSTWFSSGAADPNVLEGALVGGPDQNDDFADERDNYEQTEPATYNNGPLVGALARLHIGGAGYNQLLPVVPRTPGERIKAPASPAPESHPKPSPPSPSSPPVTHDDSPLVMGQWVTSSWFSRGRTYHKYTTVITNKSHKTVKNLDISIHGLYGPIWGVSRTRGSTYSFPPWLETLSPGQSFDFVYIHAAPQANIKVYRYDLK